MPDYHFFVPDEGLAQIHQTAIRILAELGIYTDHVEMRDRLAGQGCRVAGERVLIPPELVASVLQAVPPSFKVYGRARDKVATVGAAGKTLYMNTGILPNLYDFENGAIRRATLRDVETSTRVLDALSNVDMVYVSLLDATELPSHMVTVSDFAATLANTTKPLIGPGLTNKAEAEAVVAMARSVGGQDLSAYPNCIPFICPITPLRFPKEIVDAVVVIARAGLPLDIVTNPVMGVTAPYTIAGTVALGHAEVLATIVMAHAIRPGLPVLNQNTPSIADMRTLASTTGGPETGLMRRAVIELSHHLGIPAGAHGHSSSTRLDVQAADEKAINLLLIASTRPALLGGLGGLSNVTLTSYETLLTDNERFGAIRRALEGVAVDEDHLAFDAIAHLAAGGDILAHEHTLSRVRGPEVWRPQLALRQGLVNGKPTAESSVDRARAAARKIMETHVVEPLPDDAQRAILEILDVHARTLAA